MTIEQKAKAYDEALKWMRSLYPTMTGIDKEDAEHYFPELRESEDEDEKIRKWCVNLIKTTCDYDSPTSRKEVDDALAWLEKQCEQKPTDEEMKEILRTEYEKGRADAIAETQVAWSEEDEKEIAVLTAYIHSKDWSERHIDRALGIVDELVNKIKSIRPQTQWKPSEKQMEALDYYANSLCTYCDRQDDLRSLYNDLKKLKEE